ncbi:MAG: hypothetical protein K6T99_11745 [Armatimonadetes bacterium]|nr:hypothetical protein [Armatimonadota bacterium]
MAKSRKRPLPDDVQQILKTTYRRLTRLEYERFKNRFLDVSERMDAAANGTWDLLRALMLEACSRYGIEPPYWLEIKLPQEVSKR